MWNKIIGRSQSNIFNNNAVKMVDQFKNYNEHHSQTDESNEKICGSLMEDGNDESNKIKRLKFDEFVTKMNSVKIENASTEPTVTGKKNLHRRKQDEYKTELWEIIESKRQQNMALKQTESEQRRQERKQIDQDYEEQLNEQLRVVAKRKAERINIDSESLQMLKKRSQFM